MLAWPVGVKQLRDRVLGRKIDTLKTVALWRATVQRIKEVFE
jgi:hypothetical protein